MKEHKEPHPVQGVVPNRLHVDPSRIDSSVHHLSPSLRCAYFEKCEEGPRRVVKRLRNHPIPFQAQTLANLFGRGSDVLLIRPLTAACFIAIRATVEIIGDGATREEPTLLAVIHLFPSLGFLDERHYVVIQFVKIASLA